MQSRDSTATPRAALTPLSTQSYKSSSKSKEFPGDRDALFKKTLKCISKCHKSPDKSSSPQMLAATTTANVTAT